VKYSVLAFSLAFRLPGSLAAPWTPACSQFIFVLIPYTNVETVDVLKLLLGTIDLVSLCNKRMFFILLSGF